VAKYRDGWLSRGMGSEAEGWMAKKRYGWLVEGWLEMGG
jgi:hypothetical protein